MMLKDNPDLGKALVGIWYETIALMKDPGEKGKAAREAMAKLSGTDLAGFEAQLKTTFMYYTPAEALAFMNSPDLPKIMDLVRTFCFEHGLLGEKVKSKDAIGIADPGGEHWARPKTSSCGSMQTFMAMAAEGKL